MHRPAQKPLPRVVLPLVSFGVVGAAILAGVCVYLSAKWLPFLGPMGAMADQNRLEAQTASSLFLNGSGMRMPADGAVGRGTGPIGLGIFDPGLLTNTLPVTEIVLQAGRQHYQHHCQVCHGPLGTGTSELSAAYTARPTNLQSTTVMGYSDGQLMAAITLGRGSMPAYGGDMSLDERWAVIHYVRALQRSLHAKDTDL